MSVTVNFFSKLRSLAITLEKETEQLEHAFTNDEQEFEDESPMRVLHELRSEIMVLKGDLQNVIDKKHSRSQDLMAFIRACRKLQERTASDIKQIKDTFETYGYKPLCNENSEANHTSSENNNESPKKTNSEDQAFLPTLDTLEKASTSWDLLRPPQLSDFGLSHYQLPTVWEQPKEKPDLNIPPDQEQRLLVREIQQNVAKTPKCTLNMEEDFTQIQHFGISDYTANLNDDYTMALISKKFQKKERVVENEGIETYKEIKLKNLLATPSHLCHRTGFVDSPLPPVFCTPGLKVLKREIPSLPVETMKTAQEHSDIHSGKELKGISATPAFLSLGSDVDSVYSPRPPVFCTPGLKVHKNDIGLSQAWEHKQPIEAVHPQKQTLPALHRKGLDIAEPLPRPELSYGEYLEEPASLVLNSDHYADPAVRDYCVGTPPRPEMTMNITEDIFKYSVKPSSPPKVSKYEKLLWTPERPEMTSCITEDITQILAKYNKAKATDMAWDNQSGTSSAYDKRTPESEDKENRMY